MSLKNLIKRSRRRVSFRRINSNKLKRLKTGWRRPLGGHSKTRRKLSGNPSMPNVGYRSPRKIRGLHPSGYIECRVENLKELEHVQKDSVVRIGSTVGKKKKLEIVKAAKKKNLRVVNR